MCVFTAVDTGRVYDALRAWNSRAQNLVNVVMGPGPGCMIPAGRGSRVMGDHSSGSVERLDRIEIQRATGKYMYSKYCH